jgi:hypothetical protein
MKSHLLLLAATVTALGAACTDSSHGATGDDTPAADGGVSGDDGGGGDDGSGSDAGSDVPTTGVATIILLGESATDPIANVPVVFADKAGTLLGVEMTDAAGHASHEISRDASVTIIHAQTKHVESRVGLQPGEAIRFGSTARAHAKVAHIQFLTTPQTNTRYQIVSKCGTGYSDTANILVDLDDRCTLGGTVAVTLLHVGAQSGVIGSYITKTISVANNATETIDGASTAVPQVSGTFAMPNGWSLSGTMTETYDNSYFMSDSEEMGYLSQNNAGGSLEYRLAPASGSELRNEIDVDGATGHQILGTRRAYSTNNIDADLTGLHGWITAATLDSATRTATWTTDGQGDSTDIIRLRVHAFQNGDTLDWTVLAPGSATSIVLPLLPSAYNAYNFDSDDVNGSLSLAHVGQPWSQIAPDAAMWFGRSVSTIDWYETNLTDWRIATNDLTFH